MSVAEIVVKIPLVYPLGLLFFIGVVVDLCMFGYCWNQRERIKAGLFGLQAVGSAVLLIALGEGWWAV